MSRPLAILNLGAGVQSTTVALMAVHGELPLIDHAIFADTQWEGRKRGIDGALYLHRSCRPLADVDLRTVEDLGQLPLAPRGVCLCGV